MYSLSDMVEIVNNKLKESGIDNLVNDRLIRHYTTIKLLPAPFKDGREAKYDDTHVTTCVSLRLAQFKGLTSKVLKNLQDDQTTNDYVDSQTASLNTSPNLLAKSCLNHESVDALAYLKSLDSRSENYIGTSSLVSSSTSASSSVVGAMRVVTTPVIEQEWVKIFIKDGLELQIRKHPAVCVTSEDLNNITTALTKFKK